MLRFVYGLSKTKPLEFQSRDIWFINNSRYASVHSLIFQRTILSGNIFVVPLHRLSEMRLPVRLSSTKTIHFSFRFTILCYDIDISFESLQSISTSSLWFFITTSENGLKEPFELLQSQINIRACLCYDEKYTRNNTILIGGFFWIF